MPDFYFAIGRSPSARDWAVCRLVGQRSFLVPAGSPAERTLRTMPDVSVILDSGAYPPGNTARPTLRQYGWIVRWWSGQLDRFAWAVSYDTLGDPARTARDHDRLRDLPWRWPDDIPVVPVRAYPHHSADDILAEVNDNRADFDDEECAQYDRLRAAGELAAHNGRPACAVGGLAVARYATASADWYRRLLTDLGRAAGSIVDVSECRLHLVKYSLEISTFIVSKSAPHHRALRGSPTVQLPLLAGRCDRTEGRWTGCSPSWIVRLFTTSTKRAGTPRRLPRRWATTVIRSVARCGSR